MHHLLIVLTDAFEKRKRKRIVRFKNSLEVRRETLSTLQEQGFSAQEKFCSGPADWFVIGGRWSGELTKVFLNPLLWKVCLEAIQEENSLIHDTEEERKRADKIFKKYFPKNLRLIPLFRDSYKPLGFEDDAMIVDKNLWKKLIKDMLKECNDDYYKDSLIYLEDSVSSLNEKDVVDKMYAVVIDYHN